MLGDLREFLDKRWRKQPTVFRAAIDISHYPLNVAEIVKLTGHDLVESRMISPDHQLIEGPFEWVDTDDALLPDQHLLLVQCLEQHLETAHQLIEKEFDFIPPWQIDDVMASLGEAGASCGAHFDNYDVFLLQHTGSKIWQLDDGGHDESDLDSSLDIRLLVDFQPFQTFTTEPGDVLYIPPGFGHFGVCEDLSLTLSVGIRNPTPHELLADLSEFAMVRMDQQGPLECEIHHDEKSLPDAAIDQLTRTVSELLDRETLTRWYGCYVTRLREPDILVANPDAASQPGMTLSAVLATRLTFAATSSGITLFVNGDLYDLAKTEHSWIEKLCTTRKMKVPESMDAASRDCLQELLYSGAIK
jgi:50S ribosomal protein L16 3-hydroxylase